MADDEQPKDDTQPGDDLPRGLSEPARRALAGAGVTRLEDAAAFTEDELTKLHGFGSKGLQILRRALAAKGMAFSKNRGGRRLDKEALSKARR